ncbi:MAG: hypothetical protein FWD68_11215 [Alphaproteobacteria bacterium]|nr:hypothetical protein [Alphaproteobacteria bacterium]
MTRQFLTPTLVHALDGDLKPGRMGQVRQKKSDGASAFPENFLQDLVHDAPWSLPVEELDRSFAGLKAVCRELSLPVGSVDNLLINADGRICIVECKLWRNPEAVRDVVGQVLDYAAALAQLTYSELEAAAASAAKSKRSDFLAWAVLGEDAPEDDKLAFRDAVTLALEQGAFLILIVGDDIRPRLRQIRDFLDRSALGFNLGLVEIALYQGDKDGPYYVQPRLLLEPETVTRTVFVVEKEGQPATSKMSDASKSTAISEQEFYDRLGSCNPAYPDRVRKFLDAAQEVGCEPELLRKYNLYVSGAEHSLNLGNIAGNGTVTVWGVAARDDDIGPPIGYNYMKRIAGLLPADRVNIKDSFPDKGSWYVRFDGKSSIPLDLLLEKESEWLDSIAEAVTALQGEGGG